MDPNALGGVIPHSSHAQVQRVALYYPRAEMKGGRPSQRRRFTARLSNEKMT